MVRESFGVNFVRVDGLLVHNLPEWLHLKEAREIVFYGRNDYELNTANISKLFIVKIHLSNQLGATTVFKFQVQNLHKLNKGRLQRKKHHD